MGNGTCGTFLVLVSALCILLATTNCSRPKPQEAVALASDLERETAADVSTAELSTLVAGNTDFALDLYQALRSDAGNLLISPYSVSLALAMTYAGARGETERQMAETLHYNLAQQGLHRAFNALDQALQGRRGDDLAFRLHLINAIWGQEGQEFLQAYLDTLAQNYGAGLQTLDFAADPEAARAAINDWAMEETEGRIEDLLPPGAIDRATSLVLANAIYFKATWTSPFFEEATAEDIFVRLDGSEVNVQMMDGAVEANYARGAGYQAVELPYNGDEMSMVILLPDEGAFEDLAASLDGAQLASILGELAPGSLRLLMPKFGYTSGFKLADTLNAMGMPAAFHNADFSGIDGTRELFIDEVYHKTFIAVDEQGTEAAGATAVVMKRGMPPELRIDRPFIYVIRDLETDTVLFLGQVLDPAAG